MNKLYPTSTKEKKTIPGATYRKANIALGLSALGLALAYPFQSTFWGGVLTSGCTAALVGGLADWFAVNALFRRPLGIPAGKVIRTEIIPRNRERIFIALVSMVENELLSQEVLRKKVATYDFSVPVLNIWHGLDKTSFQALLTQCSQQFQENIHLMDQGLGQEFKALAAQERLKKEQVLPYLELALQVLADSREGSKIISALLDSLSNWVWDTEVHFWLTKWLEKAMQRYISQNPSRKFLALFLPEPSQLAQNLQKQISDYLREEQTRSDIQEWLKDQVRKLPTVAAEPKEEFKTSPEDFTGSGHSFYTKLTAQLAESLAGGLMQRLQAPEVTSILSKGLMESIERGLEEIGESPDKRQSFNDYIQKAILPILENKHQKIGEIVREGLQKYSNEMLVDLLESKVGDDLQMIRINGSIVGGLAGMLIYLITYIL